MQLQAAWDRIGIGVSLAVSLMFGSQSYAATTENVDLVCAAYMDVVVTDMYPVGLVPYSMGEKMLTDRLSYISAASLPSNKTISEVVEDYIKVRGSVRQKETAAVGMNAMRLFNANQVEQYMINLSNHGKEYCGKSKVNIEKLKAEGYTDQDFVDEMLLLVKEIQKQERANK